MTQAPTRIDAILATHNRAERLGQALAAHARMHVPAHVRYRLILVDNNSSDETARIVEDFRASCAFECRYVFEPRQGLSHARNAGLAEVDADIVAFIDDDCYPQEDWLSVMIEVMSDAPKPRLVGGSALLFDPDDLPITIVTAPEPGVQTLAKLFEGIAGLNFCFPAELARRVGPFDTCLGAGSRTRSGEDIDFFYRVMHAGIPVHYDPRLRVYHHHGRRNADDKRNLMDGYLLGRGAFYAKHVARRDGAIIRKAYWECRSLLVDGVGKGRRDCLRYLALLVKGAVRYAFCRLRRQSGH